MCFIKRPYRNCSTFTITARYWIQLQRYSNSKIIHKISIYLFHCISIYTNLWNLKSFSQLITQQWIGQHRKDIRILLNFYLIQFKINSLNTFSQMQSIQEADLKWIYLEKALPDIFFIINKNPLNIFCNMFCVYFTLNSCWFLENSKIGIVWKWFVISESQVNSCSGLRIVNSIDNAYTYIYSVNQRTIGKPSEFMNLTTELFFLINNAIVCSEMHSITTISTYSRLY